MMKEEFYDKHCIIDEEDIFSGRSFYFKGLSRIYKLAEQYLGAKSLDFLLQMQTLCKIVKDINIDFSSYNNKEELLELRIKLIDLRGENYTFLTHYLQDLSTLFKLLNDERFNELIEFIDKYIDDWFAYDPEIHSQYRYADGRRVLKRDAIVVRPPTEEELREFNSSV